MQHVSDAPMICKIIGIGPIMPSIHRHRLNSNRFGIGWYHWIELRSSVGGEVGRLVWYRSILTWTTRVHKTCVHSIDFFE